MVTILAGNQNLKSTHFKFTYLPKCHLRHRGSRRELEASPVPGTEEASNCKFDDKRSCTLQPEGESCHGDGSKFRVVIEYFWGFSLGGSQHIDEGKEVLRRRHGIGCVRDFFIFHDSLVVSGENFFND